MCEVNGYDQTEEALLKLLEGQAVFFLTGSKDVGRLDYFENLGDDFCLLVEFDVVCE